MLASPSREPLTHWDPRPRSLDQLPPPGPVAPSFWRGASLLSRRCLRVEYANATRSTKCHSISVLHVLYRVCAWSRTPTNVQWSRSRLSSSLTLLTYPSLAPVLPSFALLVSPSSSFRHSIYFASRSSS